MPIRLRFMTAASIAALLLTGFLALSIQRGLLRQPIVLDDESTRTTLIPIPARTSPPPRSVP